MKYKLITLGVCIGVLILSFSKITLFHKAPPLDTGKNIINTIKNSSNSIQYEENIMDNFNLLLNNKNSSEKEVINFVDVNIKKVSKVNASKLVLGIEDIQNRNYHKTIENCFKGNIQNKFIEEFRNKKSIDNYNVSNIKDPELKKYLSTLTEMGYKIICSEGQYFPIQNYEWIKKYSFYITEDIREYINLKSVESTSPSVTDSALIVSWDEIFNRAIQCENFLKKYSYSNKIDDIRNQYIFYVGSYLYGQDNTPTFDYKTNKLKQSVKKSYENTYFHGNESNLSKIIIKYTEQLKSTNYKLTKDIEFYRKNIMESLKKYFITIK
ncbi:hypothetical protein RBU49_13095 [Clostridium sp. MB40-C1]|uniref:hypothetical protein n=1 Tax=Clostridium sp. MB40-C1 TaxID=3070996 RepID=UPI0027DFD04D|nr:hypothetical protein [Clostridium sp. MB40-C1]WMJ79797.1 hypothetical protein RBU49_13095 [Clostridium sp. MB40-C1]